MEFPAIKNLRRFMCDAAQRASLCREDTKNNLGCYDCALSLSNDFELKLTAMEVHEFKEGVPL